MRKIAVPIYVLALAIVLVIGMGGYVIVNNRQHDKDIAEAVIERQRAVNETLRSICDRFELRDEIFLRILVDAAARQREAGDEEAAEALELNILALQLAQGDCLQDLPKVTKPPHVP
jgi:siroheme synthase (precorrin-2 oxidase/ferrochelatase)